MHRFLFITNQLITHSNSGSLQRTELLLRALQEVGRIDILLLRNRKSVGDDNLEVLRNKYGFVDCVEPLARGRHGLWSLVRPFHPELVDRLARNLGRLWIEYQPDPRVSKWLSKHIAQHQYSAIVGRYLQPTAQSGALDCSLPVILDVDDLDSQTTRSRLHTHHLGFFEKLRTSYKLTQLETIVPERIQNAQHLWLTNEKDLSSINHKSISILPNIPFTKDGSPIQALPPKSSGQVILMVGSMTHRVNVEGIERFLKNVWPVIKANKTNACFQIVGSGLNADCKARWSSIPGVDVVGFVKDIKQAYENARFTVVPLYEGGGTKIKILETLAYGRTCVVTSHAQRGFEGLLVNGQSLLVTDKEADFAQVCIDLLDDDVRCSELAERGAQVVSEYFSFDRFAQIVRETIEQVILS